MPPDDEPVARVWRGNLGGEREDALLLHRIAKGIYLYFSRTLRGFLFQGHFAVMFYTFFFSSNVVRFYSLVSFLKLRGSSNRSRWRLLRVVGVESSCLLHLSDGCLAAAGSAQSAGDPPAAPGEP